MEKVVGKQGLALHFPYKSSKFSENSNSLVNLLFNSRVLKLGHFGTFDALFPFLMISRKIRAIMAKIKLPKNPHGMVIF